MKTLDPIYVRGLAYLDQQIAALDTPEGVAEARLLIRQLADVSPPMWLAVFLETYRVVLEQHMRRME